MGMSEITHADVLTIYSSFNSPIAAFDCGSRCAPYNEYGIPFCCDTQHVVPTAYQSEWQYLHTRTDLWHLWQGSDPETTAQLQEEAQLGQVLIECLGHRHCQRGYRSIACRAFPFFPYIAGDGDFPGLTVYWEYADRCWVINNMQSVTAGYIQEAISAFDFIFSRSPDDRLHFSSFSHAMRQEFQLKKRSIPLLHRNGYPYKIAAFNGRLRRVDASDFPKQGVYRIADQLPFLDED
jgi:hypothetical protein